VRRFLGLDRSGPPPRETREGQPLNPWTLPNLVGFLRLAAIPVFLWLGLESGDGHSVAATAVFFAITAGDYVDGLLARATGQYSRLGTLLDPVVDRLAVLSGAVVCWHFELVPRWALAALAARELAMVALAEYGLRHGVDIRVNWPGRLAVFPIMGGLFLALAVGGWVASALVVAGVALALVATAKYARDGLRAYRAADP
jgi:cardiolipin synthase